jgi:hypothetical protein
MHALRRAVRLLNPHSLLEIARFQCVLTFLAIHLGKLLAGRLTP